MAVLAFKLDKELLTFSRNLSKVVSLMERTTGRYRFFVDCIAAMIQSIIIQHIGEPLPKATVDPGIDHGF